MQSKDEIKSNQSENAPEIKFLVIDYDSCTHSNYNIDKREDHLSEKLIEYARKGGYEGFYGCTHRCYLSQYLYLSILHTVKDNLRFNLLTPDFIKNDLTYNITTNFTNATKLANMAVSTRDDYFFDNCGDAYKNLIEPYEKTRQLPSAETKFLTFGEAFSNREILSNFTNKNFQLIQIAKDAKSRFPTSTIILDYVDDRENICIQAIKLCDNENWPKDVKLNIYNHCPDSGNSDIVSITKEYDPNTFSSSLCKMGLFSVGIMCTGMAIGVTMTAS